LWHAEWTPYVGMLREAEGPKVVVAHNVESMIWQRYRDTERNPLKRWFLAGQHRKYRRAEGDLLRATDCTVAVSDLDADCFREAFGVTQAAVVESGVDTAFFRPTGAPRPAERLVFLGSLDWRPNLDGVGEFLDRVWPGIVAQRPGATLALVGRRPPEWLRE